MQTPTQEYAALTEESRKRRAALDDALRPILSKQRAIAEGNSTEQPTQIEETRLDAAQAAVAEIDVRIEEFMERQGLSKGKWPRLS